jgi:hypothetical protein
MKLNRRTEPIVMRNFRVTPSEYQEELDRAQEIAWARERFVLQFLALVVLFVIVKAVIG